MAFKTCPPTLGYGFQILKLTVKVVPEFVRGRLQFPSDTLMLVTRGTISCKTIVTLLSVIVQHCLHMHVCQYQLNVTEIDISATVQVIIIHASVVTLGL